MCIHIARFIFTFCSPVCSGEWLTTDFVLIMCLIAQANLKRLTEFLTQIKYTFDCVFVPLGVYSAICVQYGCHRVGHENKYQ